MPLHDPMHALQESSMDKPDDFCLICDPFKTSVYPRDPHVIPIIWVLPLLCNGWTFFIIKIQSP